MLRFLVSAVALVVLAGCQVDATVAIEVDADGSSIVTVIALLDDEAAALLRAAGTDFVTDDLIAAGWTIEGVDQSADGPMSVVASKSARSAERLDEVLDEIAGVGVFSDVSIEVLDEFAEQRQALSLDVDLQSALPLFDDASPIAAAVGDAELDDVLTVAIDASVAAGESGSTVATAVAPRFDDDEPTAVRLTASAEQSSAQLFRWIAYAFGFLLLLAMVLGLVGSRLEERADRLQRRAPPLAPPLAPTLGNEEGVEIAAPSNEQGQAQQIRLLVVEPLSVLYQQRDSLEKYVVPFARHNRGEAPVAVVSEALDQVRAGRISTAEMWAWAGVDGDPQEIDEVFVSMRWLREETSVVLRELAHRQLPIAAVTNDAAAWSLAVRERDRLHAVWPWLVSSDEGCDTTDPAIFETLQRQSGVPYANCMYVDTDVSALDTAAQLGMQTVHFRPDGVQTTGEDDSVSDAGSHAVVTDLMLLLTPARAE